MTGIVWAVKLNDESVVGATQIGRQDVHDDLLPYLAYQSDDVAELNKARGDFQTIDGRKAA